MPDSLPRERFAAALAHRSVDRPPLDLAATDMTEVVGGLARLAPALGLDPRAAGVDEAVLRALGVDLRAVGGVLSPPSPHTAQRPDGDRVDGWGVVRRWTGHNWEIVGHPLRDAGLAELESYPFPDPERLDPALLRGLGEEARRLRETTPWVVVARHPCFGLLELGCWLCGYDGFLLRLAAEPEFVQRFAERVLAYQRRMQELYFAAVGRWCHLTTSGDDFGTQQGPLCSPACFRRLLKPWLAARFRQLRTGTDAALFHHSCGGIRPLIPDLIDLGVQVLNPLQPRAAGMEPAGLRRDFGDRLCFHGGIDTQQLLPRGTPQEVAAETRRVAAALGPGYILAPAHVIDADVPPANVVAMAHAIAA